MPITSRDSQRHTIECPRCHRSDEVIGALNPQDAVLFGTAAPVTSVYPWHTATDRFLSTCRDCQRGLAQARRRSPRRATANATVRPARTALGSTRKFGVEFEMYLPTTCSVHQLTQALVDAGLRVGRGTTQWTVKGDGSLGARGIEVTSPALSGDAGLEQIRTATRIFQAHGLTVNSSCGTHVHHDAADLEVDEIKRIAQGWSSNHHIIDWFVSPSRRAAASPYYCRPLGNQDLAVINNCTTLQQMRMAHLDRYRTLNLNAYRKFGTIEIRQHQGTINYEKVATWIALGQAIIDTAKVAPAALAPQRTVMGFLSSLGERLEETAATYLTGRAVQFGATAVA